MNHANRCCAYDSLRQKQRQLEGPAMSKKHLDGNSRSNSQESESQGNIIDVRKRTPPLSPSVGKVATPVGGEDLERSSPSAADYMVMLRRPGTPLLASVVDLKKAVHAASRAWLRDFKIRGGRSVGLPTAINPVLHCTVYRCLCKIALAQNCALCTVLMTLGVVKTERHDRFCT